MSTPKVECKISWPNVKISGSAENVEIKDKYKEVELPVNQFVKEGENELMLVAAQDSKNKKYTENTHVKMTFRVRPAGSDPNRNITLATLEFSGTRANIGKGMEGSSPADRLNSKNNFISDRKGDIAISEVAITDFQGIGDAVSRTVTLPKIGLPRWAFFDSEDITKVKGLDIEGQLDQQAGKKLIDELLPVYKAIWNALNTRNVSSILPLFDERNRELDAAFFRAPGTTAKMLAKDLRDAAADPKR